MLPPVYFQQTVFQSLSCIDLADFLNYFIILLRPKKHLVIDHFLSRSVLFSHN